MFRAPKLSNCIHSRHLWGFLKGRRQILWSCLFVLFSMECWAVMSFRVSVFLILFSALGGMFFFFFFFFFFWWLWPFNSYILIILSMPKVSSKPLHSIHTFFSIHWLCYGTVTALIRLQGFAGWSCPIAYAKRMFSQTRPIYKQSHLVLWFQRFSSLCTQADPTVEKGPILTSKMAIVSVEACWTQTHIFSHTCATILTETCPAEPYK